MFRSCLSPVSDSGLPRYSSGTVLSVTCAIQYFAIWSISRMLLSVRSPATRFAACSMCISSHRRTLRVRERVRTAATAASGTRMPKKVLPSWAAFRDMKTLIRTDTIVMLKTKPKSMAIVASLRRERLERNISLSRVVKPQPVSRDVTWKRAFSSGRPIRRKRTVKTSEMTQ